MTKKQEYNCILYEVGDKVIERYGDTDEVLEIELVDLKYVGVFPCQFLKFKGKAFDSTHFSNLFEPAEETIEKYKSGFNYFNELKPISKPGSSFKQKRIKTEFTFKRREKKEDIDLTDESVFTTKVIKRTFVPPPIKKDVGDNENN